jgi:hypothetical protein
VYNINNENDSQYRLRLSLCPGVKKNTRSQKVPYFPRIATRFRAGAAVLAIGAAPGANPCIGRLYGYDQVLINPAGGEETGQRGPGAVWLVTQKTSRPSFACRTSACTCRGCGASAALVRGASAAR